MSNQTLALQTLKSIEATAQTRSAFKFNRVRNLANSIRLLGYGFLLLTLSPVAAQTLALTENKGTGGTISTSVRKTTTPRHKIQVREYDGRTPDTYKMRNGTVLDVFQTEDARYYVIRPNGKKYFPKSLNR